MQGDSENGDVRAKARLVEMGLSKQLVDKLTDDEARLALRDISSMVEGRTTKKIDPLTAFVKLYPHKAAFLARRTIEQLEGGALGIDYSLAASIPTRLARKGLDMAATSGAKCKHALNKPLRTFFGTDEKGSNVVTDAPAPGSYRNELLNPNLDYQETTKDDTVPSSDLGAGISDSKSWNEKGDVLFGLGRFDEALDCYSAFLGRHPSSVEVWNKKGSCHFNMTRYLEATRCFDNALVLDNRNAQAWYGKACTAIKTWQKENALDCLEKTVECGGEKYRVLVSSSHAFSALMGDARFVRLTDGHPTSAPLKLD